MLFYNLNILNQVQNIYKNLVGNLRDIYKNKYNIPI